MGKPGSIALGILPTGGMSLKGGQLVPTTHGSCRIRKIIELFLSGKIEAVAIIGGKRISGPSEAEIYYQTMVSICPEIESAIVIVNGEALTTNRDLVLAREEIMSFLGQGGLDPLVRKIGVTSYTKHLERIAIELRHFGFENIELIESGEVGEYFPLIESIFTLVTRVDPEWKLLGYAFAFIAWILRFRGREDHG